LAAAGAESSGPPAWQAVAMAAVPAAAAARPRKARREWGRELIHIGLHWSGSAGRIIR
jgi:hypothetical protein